VARLMREWGMKARTYRIYRRLLTRRALLRAWPNYRLATEKPISLNQHWSSDVTYSVPGVQGEHGSSNGPRVYLEY